MPRVEAPAFTPKGYQDRLKPRSIAVNARIATIACVVGALFLGVAWWQLGSSPEAMPAPAPKVAEPAGQSAQERRERTDTLAEMQSELAAIAAERGQPLPPSEVESAQPPGFDSSALAGSGTSPREIERARERDEEAGRQEALRRWRALLREAESAADRGDARLNRRSLRDSLDELREDLGDEEFDRQLYEAGEVNRVQIRIRGLERPNARGGLAEGDLILSWNGQNVYKPADVHAAAASVEPGAQVPIVYERNGQVLTSVIDGHYVGMLLNGISVEP
jgi:hypothetical protein